MRDIRVLPNVVVLLKNILGGPVAVKILEILLLDVMFA